MNFTSIANFVSEYATKTAIDIITNSKNKNILPIKSHNTIKSIADNTQQQQQTTIVGYLTNTLESVNDSLCTYVFGMSYVDKRARKSEDVIYTDDAKKAGIPRAEIELMKEYLWKKVEEAGDVSGVYVTPSASFSDHCSHSVEEVKQNRVAHRKCHLNGVAYLIGEHTRLKKIITSDDLYGSIAIYEIKSFGTEIDSIMRKDSEVAVKRIEEVVNEKLPLIREATTGMFVFPFEKTAAPVFEDYSALSLYEFDEQALKKLRHSHTKIAGRNGFIVLGLYNRAPEKTDENYRRGKSVPKVFLAIRSYDETTSKELFHMIQERDPTLEDFKNKEGFIKLRSRAKNNLAVHQGKIAYEIIKNILGWATGDGEEIKNFESDNTGSELIHFPCLKEKVRLHYNTITELESDPNSYISSRSRSLYHDHCFTIHDIKSAGVWPYFRSREHGISMAVPRVSRTLSDSLLSDDKWKIAFPVKPSRLPVLPMGCRKIMHRDDYDLASYFEYIKNNPKTESIAAVDYYDENQNHEITLTTGNRVWYGQGDINMKLLSNRYKDSEDWFAQLDRLVTEVYDTYDLEVVEVQIWLDDFVQEFTDANQHTLNIVEILYLTRKGKMMILDIHNKVFAENIKHLHRYAEKMNKLISHWLPLQKNNLYQISKNHLLNYMKKTGKLTGKEIYSEPDHESLTLLEDSPEEEHTEERREISVR